MNRKQYRVIWRCARREYHEFDRGTCRMSKDQFVSNWSVMFDPSLLSRIWDNVVLSRTNGLSVSDQLLERISEKLTNQYVEEISQWEMGVSADNARDSWDHPGTSFIGTVFDILPSGKYTTPWLIYMTAESLRDSCYWDALQQVAAEYNGTIENGEDDPCDLFFVLND